MNVSPQKTTSTPEVSISNLLTEFHRVQLDSGADCSLMRATLQEGLDVLVWRGQFRQPTTMHLRDDWGRINFSCSLQGNSLFRLKGVHEREHELKQGAGCINFTPDCQGTSSYAGEFESVTIALALNDWRAGCLSCRARYSNSWTRAGCILRATVMPRCEPLHRC